MSDSQRFGKHIVRFVPPDLMHIVFDGDLSRDEARKVSEWFSKLGEGLDTRYLVDLRQLGIIAPDGRKELAMQRVPPRTNRTYAVDLGFIGASLRTKVLMTVVVAAATIASNVKVRTHYFATLEQGLAWARLNPAQLAG